MFTPKGKFSWFELMTSDPEAAGRFYTNVVGWTTHPMNNPDGSSYTTFNLGQAGMAGMMKNPMHTSWIGYIAVDDVDAHIEAITAAGGKLWRPATDIPGMLRFAVLSDPQGAAIIVFTPDPAMPSPERPAHPTPGTIGWHELYTTDVEAGFTFYHELFGWTKLHDMDMGPMGFYRIFDEGVGSHMGDGGMMTKPEQMPAPCWRFYFYVDAIDAAVDRLQTAGGKLIQPPTEVPGGLWTVQAQDPQGAMFALVSPTR